MAQSERKVAIITGGTGGLGKEVTRAFLEADHEVYVLYRAEARRADLLQALGGGTDRLTTLPVDVTSEDQVRDAVQLVFDQTGRIDVLVHLAGGYIGDIPVVHLEETTWDHMMDLNLKSAFLCCKSVLTYMFDQERGKIILAGALAGISPQAGTAAYAVSKAGLHALTQVLATEVGNRNISVNAVLPTIIDTPANRLAMPDADDSHWVKPEDLAKVILFLASDASSPISGALVPVTRSGGQPGDA